MYRIDVSGGPAHAVLLRTSRVTADEELVFYNQPCSADGAARLLGKRQEGSYFVERATVSVTGVETPELQLRTDTLLSAFAGI